MVNPDPVAPFPNRINDKEPVLPIEHKMYDPEPPDIARRVATIQRTIVQEAQIPIEEYEAIYGHRQVHTEHETLPAQYVQKQNDYQANRQFGSRVVGSKDVNAKERLLERDVARSDAYEHRDTYMESP